MKKVVLRNFTKFTGKHLCQSLFFNKVAGPRSGSYIPVIGPKKTPYLNTLHTVSSVGHEVSKKKAQQHVNAVLRAETFMNIGSLDTLVNAIDISKLVLSPKKVIKLTNKGYLRITYGNKNFPKQPP